MKQCARAEGGVILDVPPTCTANVNTNRTVSAAAKHHPHLKLQYRGLLDALKQIKSQEGIEGLFRGVVPRVLVHAPSVAVSWTTYEVVKKLLDDSGYL